MWIPSHIGITGNTLADEADKYATHAPIIKYPLSNKTDILRTIHNQIKNDQMLFWNNY